MYCKCPSLRSLFQYWIQLSFAIYLAADVLAACAGRSALAGDMPERALSLLTGCRQWRAEGVASERFL